MTSSRSYLVRALYDWISDNGMTPYILVDAEQQGVVVPLEYVEQGKIVLNISLDAVHDLELGNEYVMLNARFSGRSVEVVVPIMAVLAIYARENGKGMVFGDETDDEPPPTPTDHDDKPADKKPHLRVVK